MSQSEPGGERRKCTTDTSVTLPGVDVQEAAADLPKNLSLDERRPDACLEKTLIAPAIGNDLLATSAPINSVNSSSSAEADHADVEQTDTERPLKNATVAADTTELAFAEETDALHGSVANLAALVPATNRLPSPGTAFGFRTGETAKAKAPVRKRKAVADQPIVNRPVTRTKKPNIAITSTYGDGILCNTCNQQLHFPDPKVGCTICNRWHHMQCQNISKRLSAAKEKTFVCNSCKTNSS